MGVLAEAKCVVVELANVLPELESLQIVLPELHLQPALPPHPQVPAAPPNSTGKHGIT